jgi:hypothetical protein
MVLSYPLHPHHELKNMTLQSKLDTTTKSCFWAFGMQKKLTSEETHYLGLDQLVKSLFVGDQD